MNNFDLKKYLQNNLLLKEDIDVTNLSQIRKFLISSGYKRAEVNQWINKFSRDLQRRGLIKDEDQLELLYRRWLNDETTYNNLQQGLEDLRTTQQDTAADTSGDTEVRTEPFDGNIVKVIEPEQPENGKIEITNDEVKVPFLKKIGGKLASIWREDIKGFFTEDIKNLYDEKIKEFLKNLFDNKKKAIKDAKKLIDDGKRQEAREAIERIAEHDPNEYRKLEVSDDILLKHYKQVEKILEEDLTELMGGRALQKDVVDDYKDAFGDVNKNPMVQKATIDAAETGNARLFNVLFIDGRVSRFLATYKDMINDGVYLVEKGENAEGEKIYETNIYKLKSDFYRYLSTQSETNGFNFENWDDTPASYPTYADPAPDPGEFGIPYDDIDPNEDPDVDDGGDI